MRKGTTDKKWLIDEDGRFFGACMGWDFCAEHEHGISKIRDAFGMVRSKLMGLVKDRVFGPDARKITNNAAVNLHSVDHLDKSLIGYADYPKYLQSLFNTETFEKDDFCGLWSDNGFAIVSDNEKYMTDLWIAFESLDIVIYTGGNSAFGNSGLNICIASRMPADLKNDITRSDMSAYELAKLAESTKIQERLDKAGKKYYALSPMWSKDGKSVEFWLNPRDNNIYNYGKFTVAELDMWINNEGPIIKNLDAQSE
jgi:hypothetical protein